MAKMNWGKLSKDKSIQRYGTTHWDDQPVLKIKKFKKNKITRATRDQALAMIRKNRGVTDNEHQRT